MRVFAKFNRRSLPYEDFLILANQCKEEAKLAFSILFGGNNAKD